MPQTLLGANLVLNGTTCDQFYNTASHSPSVFVDDWEAQAAAFLGEDASSSLSATLHAWVSGGSTYGPITVTMGETGHEGETRTQFLDRAADTFKAALRANPPD